MNRASSVEETVVWLKVYGLRAELLRLATIFGLRRMVSESESADIGAWRSWIDWVLSDYIARFRALAEEQRVSLPDESWAAAELEVLNLFVEAGLQSVPTIEIGDPIWREGLERLTERARSVEDQLSAQPLGELEDEPGDAGVLLLSTVTDSLVLCLLHGSEHPAVASSRAILELLVEAREIGIWDTPGSS